MQRLFKFIIFIFIISSFSKVTASEEDYIVIADIAPFKGVASVYGEQLRQGINFAVSNINSSGGINGKKIKILRYDDACDPKEAEKMAQIIVSSNGITSQEKVVLVVGHTCMASTIMAMPIYANADLIHFTPSYVNNLEQTDSKKIFIMDANIDRRANAASSFLNKNFADNQIAVLYDDNQDSKEIAGLVNKNLAKISDKDIYFAEFVSGVSDYTGLVDTLSKKAIDVVYLATSLYDAQNIITQMKNKNFNAVYLSSNPIFGDGSFNPDFDGRILFSFMPDARYIPESASAVSRFRVKGFEPEGLTLYAIAIIEVFMKAYEKSKTKNIADISAILKNSTFETSVGTIGFNLAGEITGILPRVYEWQNNSYTEIAENF